MARVATPRATTPSRSDLPAGLAEVLGEAQQLGAIGPAPLDQHVAHADGFLVAAGQLPAAVRLLDLGSGGGLPGLVLAARLPEARGVLLDGRVERARLLEGFVERLGWSDRIEVVGRRAEEAGRGPLRGSFDLVVARGFARPGVTAECGAPFLRVGGRLIVSEPPAEGGAPDRWPAAPCALLGLGAASFPPAPWSFAVLRQDRPCPDRYPRRVGIPGKRPLF